MGCGSSAPVSSEIKFENGKPTFKGDEIVRSFDKGNGLLFRIVNKKTKQWALYNDTKDHQMNAEVVFSAKSKIKALGKTHVEQNDNGEFVASVTVPPLATEMFIEGDVDTFTCKFDAIPVESTGAAAAGDEHHKEGAAPGADEAAGAGDEGAAAPAGDDEGAWNNDGAAGDDEAAPAGGDEGAWNNDGAAGDDAGAAGEEEGAPAE